jgi:uncharacterized membrane-anchored protein
MDQKRFECILSVLERYELTPREKHFVKAVLNYFSANGRVTDQQESILEGIFREKIWMNKTFLVQTQ